jgi:DinB family protein
MAQTIDPVATPEAYRASLLAALGDNDPAAAQAEALVAIRALVADAGEFLRVRPVPGEWSVLECVGHIVDSELVSGIRERWIVAEAEPEIIGYDQAIWVDRLEHNADDPAILLATLEALRRANLDLWRRRPEADRERIGRHNERGPESYGLTFRLQAGHDRVHLDQARRALEAVRARAS